MPSGAEFNHILFQPPQDVLRLLVYGEIGELFFLYLNHRDLIHNLKTLKKDILRLYTGINSNNIYFYTVW